MKPPWLLEAEKYIGVAEMPGAKHESKILNFWQAIKMGGVKDDETPWCAAFVGATLEAVGIKSTRSGWAKSYLNWGRKINTPTYGSIVIFKRDGGGGHVGFVAGTDESGRILVLGGNQGDRVSVKPFEASRWREYRWPNGRRVPEFTLEVTKNYDNSSTNEV